MYGMPFNTFGYNEHVSRNEAMRRTFLTFVLAELPQSKGRYKLQSNHLGRLLRLSGNRPQPEAIRLYLADLSEGKLKSRPGRKKLPTAPQRDHLARQLYPQYLAEYRAKPTTTIGCHKLPKGERAEQTPSVRAAKRVAVELGLKGYPAIGYKTVLNLVSSRKRAPKS